jgi:hypothetical protein
LGRLKDFEQDTTRAGLGNNAGSILAYCSTLSMCCFSGDAQAKLGLTLSIFWELVFSEVFFSTSIVACCTHLRSSGQKLRRMYHKNDHISICNETPKSSQHSVESIHREGLDHHRAIPLKH